jgi:hypothetical protein
LNKQLRGLDHRESLATPLRVPHQPPARFGFRRRAETALHHPLHRRRLVLAENELLKLLVLLREEDVVLQQRQHVPPVAEALDLPFQISLLLVLPVEDVPAHQVPRDAVGEADRLGGGEDHLWHEQLRRLGVVAADLIDAQRDGLVLRRVLALDHQHGDAVDEEDDILARAILAIMAVKLFGHLEDVVLGVLVVDQDEVQLPPLAFVVERLRVAQVGEELAVAGDVRVKPAQVTDQRARAFGVLRIELPHLGIEEVLEVGRCIRRLLGGRGPGVIEPAALLRFASRHVHPADLPRVGEDAGLDGLVLGGLGCHLNHPVMVKRARGSFAFPALIDRFARVVQVLNVHHIGAHFGEKVLAVQHPRLRRYRLVHEYDGLAYLAGHPGKVLSDLLLRSSEHVRLHIQLRRIAWHLPGLYPTYII